MELSQIEQVFQETLAEAGVTGELVNDIGSRAEAIVRLKQNPFAAITDGATFAPYMEAMGIAGALIDREQELFRAVCAALQQTFADPIAAAQAKGSTATQCLDLYHAFSGYSAAAAFQGPFHIYGYVGAANPLEAELYVRGRTFVPNLQIGCVENREGLSLQLSNTASSLEIPFQLLRDNIKPVPEIGGNRLLMQLQKAGNWGVLVTIAALTLTAAGTNGILNQRGQSLPCKVEGNPELVGRLCSEYDSMRAVLETVTGDDRPFETELN